MEPYSCLSVIAADAPMVAMQEPVLNINESLPLELLQEILARVPVLDDRSSFKVCKLWNRVVSLLPDPYFIMFGKEAWKEIYKFEVEGEAPPIPNDISQIARDLRRRIAGKEAPPTCSFFLMPKGLTLNKLKGLVQIPEKNKTKFTNYSFQRIFVEFGDVPIEKSYWLLVTNGVIEDSRNKSYAEQQALILKKLGEECQVPLLLEAAVCAFMNHAISGTYFFGQDPLTYTSCQEQVIEGQMVVGGFSSCGLFVFHDLPFDFRRIGVAGCRKFC